MSKKKNKTRREVVYDLDRFDDYGFDDDFDYLEASRQTYDESLFPEDEEFEEGFNDALPRFDLDRWRDDLHQRATHRERMRQRDLKSGVLGGALLPEDFRTAAGDETYA